MKRYLIIKDFKKRFFVKKFEKKKKIIKVLYTNLNLNLNLRKNLFLKLLKLKNKTYFSKVKNICILTGKSHSVYKTFRLSRMTLRENFTKGYFTGIKRSSW